MMLQIQKKSKYLPSRIFGYKCLEICSTVAAVCILVLLLLLVGSLVTKWTGYVNVIFIDNEKPCLTQTNIKFLSIGLDSSVIAEDFYNFNLTDNNLIKMVKYLYPAYLRIGGNAADKLYFDSDLLETDENTKILYRESSYSNNFLNLYNLPNFTMTGSQWLKLMNFAQNANMEVLFDINSLIRFQNGSWDYTNAESLIKFSNSHNLQLNWELGNEPNSFRHKFNQVVNATQMAKDFTVLRNILRQYNMSKNSLLLGPDTTRPREKHKESQIYLQEFLQNAANVIDGITWHQYYVNGRTAKPQDFLNPNVLDYLKKQINAVKSITKTLKIQNIPIWLGETSSAYGGGAPNLSNTFISGFNWVDKLGLSAKMGIKVVIRQSIFKGYYALLDDHYNPNPPFVQIFKVESFWEGEVGYKMLLRPDAPFNKDWWISILYKKLVGKRVVPNYTTSSPKVRLYCHCTKRSVFSASPQAVTVFGVNLDKNTAHVRIEGLFPLEMEVEALSAIYAFELTPDRSLCSKGIRLNGNLLRMSKENNLPKLLPKIVDATSYVSMPPFSIVFWVIPTRYVKACL